MKEKLRIQRGTAVVEFAVVLPILVAIGFGIIEFSLLYYDKSMITNASRVGARVGITATDDTWSVTEGRIVDRVNEYLNENLPGNYFLASLGSPNIITTKTVTREVNPSTGTYSPGGALTVTVTYRYTYLVMPKFIAGITGPIDITGQTVMRFE